MVNVRAATVDILDNVSGVVHIVDGGIVPHRRLLFPRTIPLPIRIFLVAVVLRPLATILQHCIAVLGPVFRRRCPSLLGVGLDPLLAQFGLTGAYRRYLVVLSEIRLATGFAPAVIPTGVRLVPVELGLRLLNLAGAALHWIDTGSLTPFSSTSTFKPVMLIFTADDFFDSLANEATGRILSAINLIATDCA